MLWVRHLGLKVFLVLWPVGLALGFESGRVFVASLWPLRLVTEKLSFTH